MAALGSGLNWAAPSRTLSQMSNLWITSHHLIFFFCVCSVQVYPSLNLLLFAADHVDKHKGRTASWTPEAVSNVSAAVGIQCSMVCTCVELYRVLMQDLGLLELARPERGMTVAAWTQYLVWGLTCSNRIFLGQPVVSWVCGWIQYTWTMVIVNMRHDTLNDQK